jgi:hypothetical protein
MADCNDAGQKCAIATECELKSANAMTITPMTRGGTVITWDLTAIPEAKSMPGPLEVRIEYSRSGAKFGPWATLRDWSTVGSDFVVADQILTGSDFTIIYRLGIRDAVGNILLSRPQHVFNSIPKALNTTYREIVRRWFERAKRGEVNGGYLIRRHRWGLLCPECVDRDGQQKIRSNCRHCFDAGFDNGYSQVGGCFYVDSQSSQMSEEFRFEAGWYQQGPTARFLFLNIPAVYPGDIWVDMDTDERWVFGSPFTSSTSIGSVELLVSAPVARLDSKHIFYDYPVRR